MNGLLLLAVLAQNATNPEKQKVVVLSNPPGVTVSWSARNVGKTPFTFKREPGPAEGVFTIGLLKATAREVGQCSQARELGYKDVAPDTIVFDLARCPAPVDDWSRVFSAEETLAFPVRANNPPINYPPDLRDERRNGLVIIETVIDTLGKAEGPLTRLILYTHPGFAREALRVLERTVFKPAMIQERKVRVRVTIPLTFTTAR